MTKKIFFRVLTLIMLLLTAQNSMADSGYWTVSQLSGQVILGKSGQEPTWANLGDILDAGDKITTLSDGTAALTRAEEAMILASDSEIEIPNNGNDSQFTLIFQKLGTVLFSAKKKKSQHFQVRTPYSAAIVKGTTFAVNVNKQNAQIQVLEGSIDVKGRDRDEVYHVPAGKKSLIPRDTRKKIIINKVKNASKIRPHFGSDIEQLSLNYLSKIKIGNVKRNKFTHNVVTRIQANGIPAKPKRKKARKKIRQEAENNSIDKKLKKKIEKASETNENIKVKVKEDKNPKNNNDEKIDKEDKKPKKEKEDKEDKEVKKEKKAKKDKKDK